MFLKGLRNYIHVWSVFFFFNDGLPKSAFLPISTCTYTETIQSSKTIKSSFVKHKHIKNISNDIPFKYMNRKSIKMYYQSNSIYINSKLIVFITNVLRLILCDFRSIYNR